TCNYISKNTSEESTSLNTNTNMMPRSELEQKLDFYRKKAVVYNMEKSTQNWMRKFEEFRTKYNYVTPLELIEDLYLIEQQICEYVVQITKKGGSEYKATTIKQTINRINRYLSKNSTIHLHEKGLGKKEESMALTVQQVREILDDKFLNPKTPQSLLYRVFFRIQGDDVQQIHLLSDSPCTFGPVSDLVNYISKHPSDAPSNFYLHPNLNWIRNFMKDIKQKIKVKLPEGILTNHSGRKTATQILQDANILENAIINVTGHKSIQRVCAYQHINKHQQINMMKTLVSTIEPLKNSNKINQVASAEFNRSHDNINVNINTISMQDINMIQGEFQN
ncbi:28485_t:CDS:2, partial [Racocetra persica]